jgi:ABC-type nitrate/sulfonate/bicarbonate transport system permease component
LAKWKTHRTTIFLCGLILFLWVFNYHYHTLEIIIFYFVSGTVLGFAIGSSVLYSSWLTRATLRFLRIGLWLPFLIIFAVVPVPVPFWPAIAAVTLCTCYHYLAARSLLGLQGHEALTHVVREAILQALFIGLISRIRFRDLFDFWVWDGFGLVGFLIAFLLFVDWVFRSNFNLTADKRQRIITKGLSKRSQNEFWGAVLLALACLVIWQTLSPSQPNLLPPSPLAVLDAGSALFSYGEIWRDIKLSLLEVFAGLISGGLVALLVCRVVRNITPLRGLLFRLLPLTYISPIVLWLVVFKFVFAGVGASWTSLHIVILVGCLTFFPFVQALWGLRNHRWHFRILLAVDDALPIAFIAMVLGESSASTAGVGFVMVVTSATLQLDKGLAGFFITVALLMGISSTLRLVAKKICVSQEGREIVPA